MTDLSTEPVAVDAAPTTPPPTPAPQTTPAATDAGEVEHTPGGWPIVPLALTGANTTVGTVAAASLAGGPIAAIVAATGAVVLGTFAAADPASPTRAVKPAGPPPGRRPAARARAAAEVQAVLGALAGGRAVCRAIARAATARPLTMAAPEPAGRDVTRLVTACPSTRTAQARARAVSGRYAACAHRSRLRAGPRGQAGANERGPPCGRRRSPQRESHSWRQPVG